MKKICVITSNRSEYSRIKTVLEAIIENPNLQLSLAVCSSHLLDKYGYTIKDILADGFKIDETIYTVVEGENPVTMAKSAGLALIEFTTFLNNAKPDMIMVLGDRYESLPVAAAASFLNIPIAHLQGGETTGSIDENIRHVITKFAHIHFPATEQSRQRIIKMGEIPERVFNVGCPAIDLLLRVKIEVKDQFFQREEIIPKYNRRYELDKPLLLMIQHPVTTEYGKAEKQITETLYALKKLGIQTTLLWPNLDAGSDGVALGIKRFMEEEKPDWLFLYKHFSFNTFVHLLYYADCIIGNSSANIRESCYFGTPSVNIGTRQSNRERGKNIIDAAYRRNDILQKIKLQLSHGKYKPEYLYGDGNAGKKIGKILTAIKIKNIQKKITY